MKEENIKLFNEKKYSQEDSKKAFQNNNKPIDECIANIRCEGNCIHSACSQTQPKNLSEPKVFWYDCKEEFLIKNEMMDTREAVTILLRRSVTNLNVRNQRAGMSTREGVKKTH